MIERCRVRARTKHEGYLRRSITAGATHGTARNTNAAPNPTSHGRLLSNGGYAVNALSANTTIGTCASATTILGHTAPNENGRIIAIMTVTYVVSNTPMPSAMPNPNRSRVRAARNHKTIEYDNSANPMDGA